MSDREQASRGRTLALWAGLVLMALILLDGTSAILISLVNTKVNNPILRTRTIYSEQSRLIAELLDARRPHQLWLDQGLGWIYRPGFATATDTINAEGMRGAREYSSVKPRGVVRAVAFGDSFVYSNEVADSGAWSIQLEAMDRHVEVLNYGVGGYGTDQAFLRYLRQGAQYHPDVVLIGFVPVNLGRIVNVYRRFLSVDELPLIKPRFVLDSARHLRLVGDQVPNRSGYEFLIQHPSRVRDLGPLDYWYDPGVYGDPFYDWSATVRLVTGVWYRAYRHSWDPNRLEEDGMFNESSNAFRIELAVLGAFVDSVRAHGARPLVVLFPQKEGVERGAKEQPQYEPLEKQLYAEGIPALDLRPSFIKAAQRVGVNPLFAPGGHYTVLGNSVVARALAHWITDSSGLELGGMHR